ncbi:MAG TPA: AAA family ATPase [Fimbriiglobus sp.]|jgi:AAA+ superfamily predicted ATPase
MTPAPDPLSGLRDALAFSPDNLPLRVHFAESLRGFGRLDEAEQEYKTALGKHPDHVPLKLGLAQTYFQLGKSSTAMVIVEDLLKRPDTPPAAVLLHARLLDRAGDVDRAVRQYKEAVAVDPTLADSEFAGRMGIDADPEESEVSDGRIRVADGADGSPASAEIERPTVTFADIGGMSGVKEEVRAKIIHPLRHPDLYKAYGKSAGGGILLYGPPGCGKTHLARATAGEVKAGFVAVGIHDVLDMWIGNSERNLHAIFDQARRNSPCVLFFDEVDALAASRSDMKQSAGRMLINQFLAELDGIQTKNDGLLILAATNAPWHLDSAFRRPGRFDRVLFVPPPDAAARASIFRIQLKGKPVKDLDYDSLAKRTDAFSGADIKGVVDLAIEAKLREALKAGVPSPLTTGDLAAAAGQVKATTREWFATARNYALYANQGGAYDDVLKYLKM